jgi:hypothetical protein
VAKKRAKVVKKRTSKGAAAKPAAKRSTPPRKPAPVKPVRAVKAAPARAMAAPAGPPLLERAERLRDEVLRSKMTHPDPWRYTTKARGFATRAQGLVDEIAREGASAASERALAALAAELAADRDFKEAKALF